MTVSELDRKRFLLSASAAAGVLGLAAQTSKAASAMPAMMPLPAPDQRADPDMKRVLEAFLAFNAPPLTSVNFEVARELPSINVDAVAAASRQNASRACNRSAWSRTK